MHSIAGTCFAMGSLALLSGCVGQSVVVHCNDGDYPCHQDTWRPIAVHPVANLTQGAVDSVITVRVKSTRQIAIDYAFNNPCQYSVTARLRRFRDTLDVAFMLSRSGTPEKANDSVPDITACPAAIMNQVYEVIVSHRDYGIDVVRGFNGDTTTLLAVRTVPKP
jgi:hypothetical protein